VPAPGRLPLQLGRAYTGERSPLPLDMTGMADHPRAKGYFGPRGYREFMDQDEGPYVGNLFARGSPRILASSEASFSLSRCANGGAPRPAADREQIIAGVAQLLQLSARDIFSATHAGALGRALVAWYGLRSGAATLTDMGRWFSFRVLTWGRRCGITEGVRRSYLRRESYQICRNELQARVGPAAATLFALAPDSTAFVTVRFKNGTLSS